MQMQSSNPLGNRNRVSGFLRLFVFSLLAAAFGFTSLHAQTVAYVTNTGQNSGPNPNTVSVIDTATNTVTATIPVQSTLGVAVTPDGTRAYVTRFFPGSVLAIDTASNTVIATINTGGNPGIPAVTPDGKSVYVPTGAAVKVIDTATNGVTTTVNIPNNNAGSAAITPDGTRAYIVGFHKLFVVDIATNTVVQSIDVSSGFNFEPYPLIAITPDGSTVYVGGGDSNPSVQAIATASNSVVATIPMPVGVNHVPGLDVTPDGSRIYLTGTGVGISVVFIIDTATNTVEPGTIASGPSAIGVAATPDGAFVYVANLTGNNLSVISTATNTVVATVPVGAGPEQIAIANMSTPFSNLTVKSLTVAQNGFAADGTFSLGAGSTGIDLAHQPLTLTVNGSSITIPAGSFRQVGGNFHFVFNGPTISFNLMATGGTSTDFKFAVTVTGTDLTGGPNPATVNLKIGSNSGSTTAPF